MNYKNVDKRDIRTAKAKGRISYLITGDVSD